MQSQQRLDGRPVIEPHIQTFSLAIDAAVRGTVKMIDCGEFVRRVQRDTE